jgi:MFS family permease
MARIAATTPESPELASGVLRKVAWRLLPFLCLLYVVNILDRTNAGFARLTMEADLGISTEAFDFCYGIFYFGYLAFEVPANLLLRRVGARRWIARIMISWGLVTCATVAVTGAWSFGVMRILLGVAEAGFFPGIILYLTFWFPGREQARVMALFMAAISVAGLIGYPLSGAVMKYLHGTAGLSGWQWLYLVEGVPSIALGVLVLFYLPDGPKQARWLMPAEQAALIGQLDHEDTQRRRRPGADQLGRALIDPRVWLLICIYFTVAVASNAYGAKVPKMIGEAFDTDDKLAIGLLGAVPNLCAIVTMTLLGVRSDRKAERRRHLAFAAFLGAAGWAVAALAPVPWLALAGFAMALAGMMSMLPLFWALPTAFLSGAAAAGGIALINSVANLGGLMGPNILGQLGIWAMVVSLCAGGMLTLFARTEAPR